MKDKQRQRTSFGHKATVGSLAPVCARRSVTILVLLLGLAVQPLFGAEVAATSEQAKEIVRQTSAAVEEAGSATADAAKNLWQKIDEARLKNRTPDELVAWVIMGVLVGSVAGMLTSLKPTGLGKLGRLALGLAGAFLGGIVVHVGQFNFGWGPVLIRYEDLFFSFLGAVLIVAAGRIIRSRLQKKTPAQ